MSDGARRRTDAAARARRVPVAPGRRRRLPASCGMASAVAAVLVRRVGCSTLPTIMPGLGYWDTGEFQALGPVLGIAHPTGYPSYTLLLWLASVVLQPFGEAAFRANLLSALLVSGAAPLPAIAIVQLTRRSSLGVLGGLAFAVAPIAWRNALRADPHAFQVFLVGLLLVLLIALGGARASRGRSTRAPRAVAGCVGGSSAAFAGRSPTTGSRSRWRRASRSTCCSSSRASCGCRGRPCWRAAATLVLTTVAIYAYLPIRSSMDPPLDYAHPASGSAPTRTARRGLLRTSCWASSSGASWRSRRSPTGLGPRAARGRRRTVIAAPCATSWRSWSPSWRLLGIPLGFCAGRARRHDRALVRAARSWSRWATPTRTSRATTWRRCWWRASGRRWRSTAAWDGAAQAAWTVFGTGARRGRPAPRTPRGRLAVARSRSSACCCWP